MPAHVPTFACFKSPTGIVFANRAQFDRYVASLGDGEEFLLTIKPKGKKQTDEIRGYYHGAIVPIFAEYMGEPLADDAHEALAWKFLRIEDHPVTGAPRRKSTSPSKMPLAEMVEYVNNVIAYGTVSLGLRFPEAERDPSKREKKGQAA